MVSVVIPVYNAGPAIRRAIDSVLAQSFTDYEIIVVDDGSTDNTEELVKKYGSKVKYIYQENSGRSSARNTGIQAAKGKWVAFLDADDQWLPDKLKIQMELLDRNSELMWCAGNFIQTDGSRSTPRINPTVINNALTGRDYFLNYFEEAAKGLCFIATPTVIVKKSIFEKIGLFDISLLFGEDMDTWWRIAHKHPQVGYIAEPIARVYLNIQDQALQKQRLARKSCQNIIKLAKKHFELSEKYGDTEVYRALVKRIACHRLCTAIYNGYKKEP